MEDLDDDADRNRFFFLLEGIAFKVAEHNWRRRSQKNAKREKANMQTSSWGG